MIYDRGVPAEYREIDRWDDGVGWLAHPDEGSRRASHAVAGADGIWLLDPLWAPGVDDLLDEFIADREDDVAGVAICSNWHTRDADRFAHRYDVPVFVPEWMGRVDERTGESVRRYEESVDPAVRTVRCEPIPLWNEAILYWDDHNTLYVPESMGTVDPYTIGDERIGLELFRRLDPPRSLRELEPDRVLVGHGAGVLEDATRALEFALAGARRRFPRALLENGPATVRALYGAVRG
ncbi:hypothetical protein [Natrialba taiwanensis]|uniref:Beta-lactamase n=1 Tax=Natrialba taiwanensis DSM 12281 TaxID=1230458 RepID=M0ADB3_9EURY|nr:hypothetical protein [Natrialba taiwanensis]ELY95857.1 hypothetical protein C484_02649 [Natrialba taiwanensis DSM 12281]